MKQYGLIKSFQIRKWGFQRANLLDRYINYIGLTFSSQTESPQGINMSKEEFVNFYNNLTEEEKEFIRDLLLEQEQRS